MWARLEGAATEAWHFDSPEIESPDIWKPMGHRRTPLLDRLIASHAPVRSAQKRPNAASSAPRTDTVAAHLLLASDPVNAVLGGSQWCADSALRELSRRNSCLEERVRLDIGLDDPSSAPDSFRELCEAVDVGLVVSDVDGFQVVCLRDRRNLWLEKTPGGWSAAPWCRSPVARDVITTRTREKALQLVSADRASGIKTLRRCAETVGLSRPFPRTKEELRKAIQGHLEG
nr:hypothetical protein TetV2_00133 [Oceanusvirus sp.]